MNTYRILQVDDNPELGYIYKSVLEFAKYPGKPDTQPTISMDRDLTHPVTIESTTTVNDFLARLPVFDPHIVVVDDGMPDKMGLDLLKWMRTQPRYDHVRMITANAYPIPENVEGYGQYIDTYIVLPVTPSEFISAINKSIALYIEANGPL